MIVVRLIGGLGNQMFQYAMAKNVAVKNNVILKLDISDLINSDNQGNYTIRNFELNNFNIKSEIAVSEELNYFKKKSKFLRYLNKLIPIGYKSLIDEKKLSFDKRILNLKGNKYFTGYWQSELYFREIRNQLLDEFTLITINSDLQNIINDIKNSESVSMHIRRGDYIIKYSDYYYTQTPEYYLNSLKNITAKYPKIKVFVFSDDIEWAKTNIKTDVEIIFVTPNKSYEDLFLMSLCKHNIIANSSFSWWGAWLNENPDKICIAPTNWFKDKTIKIDIIPNNWVTI